MDDDQQRKLHRAENWFITVLLVTVVIVLAFVLLGCTTPPPVECNWHCKPGKTVPACDWDCDEMLGK